MSYDLVFRASGEFTVRGTPRTQIGNAKSQIVDTIPFQEK